MLFVDSGAWFALSVASDPDHERAKQVVSENVEPLLTTDYVVDELLTLFVVRREKAKGREWLRDVLGNADIELVQVDQELFAEACRIYTDFADKDWSFTDCTSYATINRLGIKKAFSFDRHFQQFATVQVLP
jgi:uncharacterized protein